jgi:dynein heavy chain
VDTVDNILATFNERVREKLHINLCMSPVGDTLRIRCRMFPSLVNCCTLNWFDRWPEQALLYVSSEFLKEIELPSEEIKKNLSQMCMKIHTSVEAKSTEFFEKLRRMVYTTPKSYLDLIHLYISSLDKKREEEERKRNRLAVGLKKLQDTNLSIADFKIKIEELQPQLIKKNEEISKALVIVAQDKKVADEKERVVSEEAKIVGAKKAEAEEIANEAQKDLKLAEPELMAA